MSVRSSTSPKEPKRENAARTVDARASADLDAIIQNVRLRMESV